MTEIDTANSPKAQLAKIISIMEIEATIDEETVDESTICYRIDCKDEDAKLLIGRKGQTLEALQFLLRQICKSSQEEEGHFILDVLDYRARRKESIINSSKAAAVAVLNGEQEEFSLLPMSAFERRIVHNYLHEHFPELCSQSRGMGNDRYIVISYGGLPEQPVSDSETTLD